MRCVLLLLIIAAAQSYAATCDQLTALAIQLTSVTSATRQTGADNPQYCRVLLTALPVPDSEIHVELWLPEPSAWNGKFLGTGNGGYSSQLSYGQMRAALKNGYAVAGTDTGHTGDDLKFGVGHPAKIEDWAYRAVHVMTEVVKPIIRSYYGRFAAHAYFSGCSTGGQQALSEAQRYPADYDGIVAGDPGNDRLRLNVGFLWSWRAVNLGPDSRLPAAKLPLLHNSVMQACDALDGINDGILGDPRKCHFEPESLLCESGDGPNCLMPKEAAAAKAIYAGARNPRTGESLFPGWIRGSETLPDGGGSWSGYFIDRPEPARLSFWRFWMFGDPNWDPLSFDFDRDMRYAGAHLNFISAVDPDLSAFQKHGGKLLMYQGWADPVVPPEDTIQYFESVQRKMGGFASTSSFARLFMVPGMGHCRGGSGPDVFDSLGALDEWVDQGRAPNKITAQHIMNKAVDRTRPLCSYPEQAVWTGKGSTDHAENFTCSVRAPRDKQ